MGSTKSSNNALSSLTRNIKVAQSVVSSATIKYQSHIKIIILEWGNVYP